MAKSRVSASYEKQLTGIVQTNANFSLMMEEYQAIIKEKGNIAFFPSKTDFPKPGDNSFLYIDMAEPAIYRWDQEDGLPGNYTRISNDYPDEDRAKLAGVEDGATKYVYYVHDQIMASNHWTINHNIGRYPSVMIVDTAGSVVVGDVKYISDTELEITFKSAFSGKAYLN